LMIVERRQKYWRRKRRKIRSELLCLRYYR